jgi:hypothetical protein
MSATIEKFSLSCVSTDSFENCNDPIGHLRYMRKLAAKPYRVIENDFLMSKHGHAIVRQKEGALRTDIDNLDTFLVQDLSEETIKGTNGLSFRVHRILVASNRGADYCRVGWVIKGDVSHCMCCFVGVPDVNRDRHHCAACGNVVCSACSTNTAVIEELQTMEKFVVCTKCFKGEGVEIEAVKSNVNHDVSEANEQPELRGLASRLASVAKISAGGSSDSHLSFIRSMVKKPVLEVRKAYELAKDGRALVQRRSSFSFSRTAVEAFLVSGMAVQSMDIAVAGRTVPKRIKLYRVYITSIGGGEYCQTGWVIQDSATHCMRCEKGFGMLSTKHNCVGCGDVVCHRCSPHKVIIHELRSEEPHRACSTCYTLQPEDNSRIATIHARCNVPVDAPDAQQIHRSDTTSPIKSSATVRSVSEEDLLSSQERSVSSIALGALLETGVSDTEDATQVVEREEEQQRSQSSLVSLEVGTVVTKDNLREILAAQPSLSEIPIVEEFGEDEPDSLSDDANSSKIAPSASTPIETNSEPLVSASMSTSSHHLPLSRAESDSELLVPPTPPSGKSLASMSLYSSHNLAEEWLQGNPSSVLAYDSEALDREGLLSSDGSTAVIPIVRLTDFERETLEKRGYLPSNSTHAFVPVFKLHLRHVETVKKEVKKFQLPEVKLQHVSAEQREKKKVERRPSEAMMVQLRSLKSNEKVA